MKSLHIRLIPKLKRGTRGRHRAQKINIASLDPRRNAVQIFQLSSVKRTQEDTGLNAEEGMRLECETEEKLCYSNPYMLQVWKRLQKLGKRMIIVSDMYLPRSCIERILQKTGYMGAERIYISNEYGENKAGGDLFHRVIRDFSGARIVHIGDNPHSDQKMAKASGLDILPYQNVNKNVLLYRPMDMSSMIGGAYRGLVSNHLYNGSEKFSIDYEYGYVYGGIVCCGGPLSVTSRHIPSGHRDIISDKLC